MTKLSHTLASNDSKLSRRYFCRRRRSLSSKQRLAFANQASRHLYKLAKQLPKFPKHAKIGIYYDGFGELPTQPILDWCVRSNHQAFLPVVGSLGRTDKRLRFSPIYHSKLSNLPTYRHSLGMQQHCHPRLLWAEQLDVIFCPLVAIDNTGTRMGMGGGYYDRTLTKTLKFARNQSNKKPLKVAWCYDFQVLEHLPRQPWDVPMDVLMTQNGIKFYR